MSDTVYNFDPEIFSIKVKRKKQRFTRAQILKSIGCEHLSLEKVLTSGGNYFVFTYDTHPHLDERPEGAEFAQESVYVQHLHHADFDKWVQHGKDLVHDMEGEPQC